ncbi:MAG: membrane protein insertion efficiency factor YidD [Candidatus Cloacimonetes bacterium]|nr:membrane protein insertion efficiency factor YidD [Candidatus Cloacimonadota bacterium]
MNKIMILILKVYRSAISPLFPPSCRFTPTCSAYSLQAFSKYSFFKALYLSTKRILKCHPFHPGGYDPLP